MQNKYQWSNKGKYGHMGGILHAFLHAVGTFLCVMWFETLSIAYCVCWFDGVLHYHIDYAKMNLNKKFGWGPNTHEEFWWLLGLDQLLHALTYIGLIAIFI